MTSPQQTSQAQQSPTETRPSDKELNFRAQEQKYERLLAQERAAREAAEKIAYEAANKKTVQAEEEDDDSEPYVDHKKLQKKLNKFGQSTQSDIQRAMEQAKIAAKEELKQEMWLENNPDFDEVMQHAEKFAQRAPKLADSILKMPPGFERNKLVYQNIKELGVHKPEQKQSSIQDKIEANRRSPYYQPSGVGTSPYNAGQGDFSEAGQKNAYAKLQELKKNLRI